MRFTGKTYVKVLKTISAILPILVAAYVALANTWGLPAAKEVTETSGVIVTLCMGLVAKAKPEVTDEQQAEIDEGGTI